STGRWEAAVAEYRKAVNEDPTNGVNHQILADALEKSGDLDSAIEEYRLAASLLPSDGMVRVQLAKALVARDGVSDEAIDLFRRAVELAPGLEEARRGLASVLLHQQRYKEALEHLDATLEVDPADPGARLLRARALAAVGRETEARLDLETILAARPDSLEAALDLAALEARQGEFDGAIKRLEGLLQNADDDNSRAILNFEIGGLNQLAGDDEAALEHYDAAIEQAPELRDAQFNRAVSLGRLGRQAEAEEQLRQVLEIDPQDERSYLALAQALAGRGQFAESREVLQVGLDEVVESKLLMGAMIQLLLASPDPETRDAAAAVPLATRLHEIDPSVQNGAMVAAALGASGRSAEAAEWQARVLREAEAAGWPQEQLQRMRSDLALYRQRAGGG
ncbi:MAG: tetratricopeptide repeat protein, partial [Thermoanaerobaculia bacterium]